MKPAVLFVHNAFPGQFGDLAAALTARGVACVAIGEAHAPGLPDLPIARYAIPRSSTPGIFPLAAGPEADLIRAAGALAAAKEVKGSGFEPQVIIGHATWGETLLLSEVFPQARQVIYPEFFPQPHGFHVGFDPEFKAPTEAEVLGAWALGCTKALALTDADVIVCPTPFQASTLPAIFHPRVRIIHEGIDVDRIRPGRPPRLQLPDGQVVEPGRPVITHVNNHLEPMRGLHIFARALPRVLAAAPEAQVIVFGHEAPLNYSGEPPEGLTWKQACLQGVDLEPGRVHFMGHVPHEQMLATLRASAAHVYYSYPFVLSWSVLEAMASGCYVIGSDTTPVRDVIEDGVNGRLLPFFDTGALSEALITACRDPQVSARLRAAARDTVVSRYSTTLGRAAWFALLQELGLKIPAP